MFGHIVIFVHPEKSSFGLLDSVYGNVRVEWCLLLNKGIFIHCYEIPFILQLLKKQELKYSGKKI